MNMEIKLPTFLPGQQCGEEGRMLLGIYPGQGMWTFISPVKTKSKPLKLKSFLKGLEFVPVAPQ